MKKMIKKLKFIMAAACLGLMLPVMVSYAAEGSLDLSDPTGKVGEEIVVKVKAAEAAGQPIGDVQATLSYDTALLEFVSGTNAEASDGTITLSASGTGTETEHSFELTFKALAEGSASIQVTSSTAYLYSDETLNLTPGTSTVTIEAGDGTDGTSQSGERVTSEENIEIAGTMYAIYENFTEALIPDGFVKTTVNYNGEEHSAIRQESSGAVFFYMVTGSNDPVMIQYDEADNSFYIAEQVYINDDFYLLILGKGDGSSLPEEFESTTMELNGTTFPVWQNMSTTDYYLVYALSSKGTEGFYQYDSIENTYQRYEIPKVEKEEEPEDTMLTKILGYVNQYFLIIAAAAAAVLLLLIIIILIMAVKLGRRNAELDEIYDSYDEEPQSVSRKTADKKSNKKSQKKSNKKPAVEEDYDEDMDEEFLEDDFEDDDYDDFDYEDDDYDDDGYDDYDDEYDDDELYEDDFGEDEDDAEDYSPEKKRGKNASDTEDYDLDFIDL